MSAENEPEQPEPEGFSLTISRQVFGAILLAVFLLCGVAVWRSVSPPARQYMVVEIPTKAGGLYDQLDVADLNAYSAKGWRVAAALPGTTGLTRLVILEK